MKTFEDQSFDMVVREGGTFGLSNLSPALWNINGVYATVAENFNWDAIKPGRYRWSGKLETWEEGEWETQPKVPESPPWPPPNRSGGYMLNYLNGTLKRL